MTCHNPYRGRSSLLANEAPPLSGPVEPGAPTPTGGLADGPGRGSVEQLRAVVVGAGPGGGACERAGIADTVPGLVLIFPGAVVEVRVVIGDPGAVEPVDRHAPVGFGPGGVGYQPGVSARQAQQRRLRQGNHPPHIREIAGFNDVKGGCINEVGVVMDARAGGGLRFGSDEQKAEGVADSEVVGDQRGGWQGPVRKGARWRPRRSRTRGRNHRR